MGGDVVIISRESRADVLTHDDALIYVGGSVAMQCSNNTIDHTGGWPGKLLEDAGMLARSDHCTASRPD